VNNYFEQINDDKMMMMNASTNRVVTCWPTDTPSDVARGGVGDDGDRQVAATLATWFFVDSSLS